MNPLRKGGKTLAVALALASVGADARAGENAAAAQALFDQGKKAMSAKRYADACPRFEESMRLDAALGTLLNLAECYQHEGKLATAWSKFLELGARARSAGQAERAAIAKARAAALVPRLSNLVITVDHADPGMEVKRDGVIVGTPEWGLAIPVDAGTHSVDAAAPGRKPWATSIVVSTEGATLTVAVPTLERLPAAPVAVEAPPEKPAGTSAEPPATMDAPPDERSPLGARRAVAIGTAAVGLAGIGVGTFFGLRSIGKHDDANRVCPDPRCPTPAGADLWSDARSAGNVSTVAFVVGGVGIASAAVLWFTAKRNASAPSAQLELTPRAVQLRGVW